MSVFLLLIKYNSLLDRECEEYRKLTFVLEQLCLLSHSKYSRHYSPQLTAFGFLLHAHSSAAYRTLLTENVVSLPLTLNKVTRRLNMSSTTDNLAYLKLHVSKLNEFERTVLLIIDEIYAKRVEYSCGEVQGLTGDGDIASTLLCFMVIGGQVQRQCIHVSNGQANG